ncbi:MAG: DegT/DnrJ/EryC1/StrS family aminotransferase [Dehalococcoidia bacterium]|nr:DegT/DnrJ/EryC1/StrS family aminotransferase [Dehalococcoidia bacterium]
MNQHGAISMVTLAVHLGMRYYGLTVRTGHREQGIETLISWPVPMHHQHALNLGHFSLPQTEALSRELLSLPMYPELSDTEVATVCQAVRGFSG